MGDTQVLPICRTQSPQVQHQFQSQPKSVLTSLGQFTVSPCPGFPCYTKPALSHTIITTEGWCDHFLILGCARSLLFQQVQLKDEDKKHEDKKHHEL